MFSLFGHVLIIACFKHVRLRYICLGLMEQGDRDPSLVCGFLIDRESSGFDTQEVLFILPGQVICGNLVSRAALTMRPSSFCLIRFR